ncbi:uncharacterized protein LOC126551263 [Aphis gossypii]|uniref:uncharacterized protein LOC126551263 n=1 Tax=Aphis gossypii TaxID=80765 RepID=UPI002158E42C|nr:uncharacterized protein LOC126551263 [Aphis gossypii]
MYGNIYFYGGRGRGSGGGRGRGRGGDGNEDPPTPAPKKFTGKCDLCKAKGHKVLECPQFLAIMAKANVISPSNGADELGGACGSIHQSPDAGADEGSTISDSSIHQSPDAEKNGSQEK